ncbi:putative membrane-associated kinase regulator 2 [Senna tora]|uniref:Putative membrane-associated kinase regulator 2 n=1 Tax=Senna tora TaxID=362788 RepID=A0A834TTH4_9FABA|nr:putative membrane-associated kinase regulator 2 [Senna tora]
MEAFSLLKYWRTPPPPPTPGAPPPPSPDASTTIVTAIAHNHDLHSSSATASDDDDADGDGDDGPFFDLEFTVPDEVDDSDDAHQSPNVNVKVEDESEDGEGEGEGEGEFKFTLSPSTNDRSDLSPSEDLFFKGKLVEVVEPSSFVINPSEPNSKPQFPASLLKSATKFRVFMSALKKSRPNVSDKDSNNGSDASNKQQPETQKKPLEQQRKLFTVKFKVEEVPIMSLFTRDNSSRGVSANNNKSLKQNTEDSLSSASDEKRFSKEVMQKYLRMVKPLYIKVSKRYGGKLRFSGQLNVNSRAKAAGPPPPATAAQSPAPAPAKAVVAEKTQNEADACETQGTTNVKNQKQGGNLPAGLKVVCKHLGKSRSASSAVAAAPPGSVSSRRRDDSLLQQQDGIQGAILHCKRMRVFSAATFCERSLARDIAGIVKEFYGERQRQAPLRTIHLHLSLSIKQIQNFDVPIHYRIATYIQTSISDHIAPQIRVSDELLRHNLHRDVQPQRPLPRDPPRRRPAFADFGAVVVENRGGGPESEGEDIGILDGDVGDKRNVVFGIVS